MYESSILPEIRSGMKAALSDATMFTENFAALANVEYLITVNIAQKISGLGPLKGPNSIKTVLEMRTKDFATACVPLMKKLVVAGRFGASAIMRKRKNTDRNGRIDIAVLKANSGLCNTPICAIEVKGFDQSSNNILKDLRRNSEYFQLKCNTGTSNIEFTAFCALHALPKTVYERDQQGDLAQITQKYRGYMRSVSLGPNVEYEIDAFTASSTLLKGGESQEQYDDMSPDFHHHVGVILIFRWRRQDNCVVT